MPELRAFLAIPLTDALKQSVTQLQKTLQPESRDIRWVQPGNLHLTLHFFGNVAQEDLEKIEVSMLSVKRTQRAFEVAVKGLGAFPNLQRPRVIWLGLDPQAPLQGLFKASQSALVQSGFPPEARPFAPHLTIGRLRQRTHDLRPLAGSYADRLFGTLPVTQLVLYESRLHSNGAEHIPIHTVELAGNVGMDQ